jgi:uncharacterized protein
MNIYLPIAEVSVNSLLLLGIGGGIGFLSGIFGVGGGFLMTPLLILIGIPPAVAVATGSNQICAASFSGVLSHWRRRTLDVKMGMVLLAGGLVGSALGVWLFAILRALGQVELVVALCYVVFLGSIGALMLVESLSAMRKARRGGKRQTRRRHNWVHFLPLKMRFRASNLYISAIPPFGVGMLVGTLAAIMGVGGGFIMIPAMIYLLGMATNVVVGTSLFQIMFVTGATTLLHAIANQTVDAILALILLVGGVIGTQIGVRLAPRLRAEQLRILLSLMVLIVGLKLAWDLVSPPEELFTLSEEIPD